MSEMAVVTTEDVVKVAELANLELTAEEMPRMARDLNAILGHIAQLNELDTEGVPAMAQVGEMLGAEVDGGKKYANRIRIRFAPRPSRDVSDWSGYPSLRMTAVPTTRIVPTANDWKTMLPAKNSPPQNPPSSP